MSYRPTPVVQDSDARDQQRDQLVKVTIHASENMSSSHNLTWNEALILHWQLGEWIKENRKVRRRGRRSPNSRPVDAALPETAWPPDPVWDTDDRGRFHYTDYDGESLHIWRDKDGELWIDKKGEGPVYVRQQDVALILGAVQP